MNRVYYYVCPAHADVIFWMKDVYFPENYRYETEQGAREAAATLERKYDNGWKVVKVEEM